MRTISVLSLVAALLLVCAPLGAQQLTWYDVPVAYGPAGEFACVTRNQPFLGPIIVCNPQALVQLPQAAQTFLLAHEHGHVYQMVNGQSWSTNAEVDADCYAAKYLAANDPETLKAVLLWMYGALGQGGVDILHASGAQTADWVRRCAGW
jgi:hypothetical protein